MPEDLPLGSADPTTPLIHEVTETMGGDEGDDGSAAVLAEAMPDGTEFDEEETGYPYSRKAMDAIRTARDDQGISARQLADMCQMLSLELGVRHTLTRGRVSKLENGLTSGGLTVDEVIIASRALGVSPGALLGDALMRMDEQQAAEELRELHARLGAVLRNLPSGH